MQELELGSVIQLDVLDTDDGSELDVEKTDVHAAELGSDMQLFRDVVAAGNDEAAEYTEVQEEELGSVMQPFSVVTSLELIPDHGRK